jgi:multicomponent Na+:H+ antiporter subunit D
MLLGLPILVPLVTAAACIVAWRRPLLQRCFAVAGAAGLLGSGLALVAAVREQGVFAMRMGNWPAPFAITLVADLYSAAMILVTGVIGLVVAVYSLAGMDMARQSSGYYPLVHFLLTGVSGAFLTGDLFNLYVWVEVMLMASFALLALGGEKKQLQGGIKYVTLNLLASAILLSAVGILYGLAGTLNMADLAQKLEATHRPGLVTSVAILFLIAFGIKAAVFPLFFWLPASYHTPPAAVSALFGGLLSKVGVYALIRVFTLIFMQDPAYTHGLIVGISILTMVTGVLGAMAQNDFRRILSFHIISQIGYMTLGLGLAGIAKSHEFARMALAASIYYIVHNIFAKTNLFLVSGVVERLRGTAELKSLGSLYRLNPGLAALFFVSAFALAGLPPLSGFFAKLSVIQAGLAMGAYIAVAVALVVGLLTLYSMLKIWTEAFWKESPDPVVSSSWGRTPERLSMALPMIALATLTVCMGLFAQPVITFCEQAADQLLDRDGYIRAVLGDKP